MDVADELSRRGYQITLVDIGLDRAVAPRSLIYKNVFWKDDAASAVLHESEMIVVHVGDNYSFHAGAIHILKHWQCVGVFHDANIYGLFRSWAFDNKSDEQALKLHDEVIALLYHDKTGHRKSSHASTAPNSPNMTDWLARYCAAAIAHSRFYEDELKQACPGEVFSTPLSYSKSSHPAELKSNCRDGIIILTVGHVNSNKCCDLMIQAIAVSSFAQQIEYRIVGPISNSDRERLYTLAIKNNVRVTMAGRVDDQRLADELEQADIVSCLRRPILEGASASAIEAMLSSRPIIVPDGGFYQDIEDSAAVKVPEDFSILEVASAIDHLASSSDTRQKIGANGKRWAEANCNVIIYVDTLERALSSAISYLPYHHLASSYANQLAGLGFDLTDEISFKIADQLQSLICNPALPVLK